jgi:endonuclease YncB( thermonuclease family)
VRITSDASTLDPFARRARLIPSLGVENIHDGDTVRLEIDSAYGGREEPELRLDGVYMPELRDPGGPEMRRWIIGWFAAADPGVGWPFWVEAARTKVTVKAPEPGQRMTFARYLATVWRFDGARKVGPSLNEALNAELALHPEWGHGKGAGQ